MNFTEQQQGNADQYKIIYGWGYIYNMPGWVIEPTLVLIKLNGLANSMLSMKQLGVNVSYVMNHVLE